MCCSVELTVSTLYGPRYNCSIGLLQPSDKEWPHIFTEHAPSPSFKSGPMLRTRIRKRMDYWAAYTPLVRNWWTVENTLCQTAARWCSCIGSLLWCTRRLLLLLTLPPSAELRRTRGTNYELAYVSSYWLSTTLCVSRPSLSIASDSQDRGDLSDVRKQSTSSGKLASWLLNTSELSASSGGRASPLWR